MYSKQEERSIISISTWKKVLGGRTAGRYDSNSARSSLEEDSIGNRTNCATTKSSSTLLMPRTLKKNKNLHDANENLYAFDIARMRKPTIQVINKEATRTWPSSKIISDDDSYAGEMQYLQTATARKLKAAPSRTATASDPYFFNRKKVRSFIRRESKQTKPITSSLDI